MKLSFALTALYLVSTDAHGYLNKPISRNAVGLQTNKYCGWDKTPCFGDVQSLGGTTGPDATGCTNSGGRGEVTGSGARSFATTGIKTSYGKGQIVDVEVDVTAYHGGKFEFRLQDVGNNVDPDGSKWETVEPLNVLSFTPECGSACIATEPCVAAGTCAQIPLTKGDHSGNYKIRVQLPADTECDHCVMQWHWTSSNSCDDKLACSSSEQFWNCADIQIGTGGSSPTPTPVTPVTSPTPTPAPASTDTNCPAGQLPYANTPTTGVCSCGVDWPSASTGGILCTSTSIPPVTTIPNPPSTGTGTPPHIEGAERYCPVHSFHQQSGGETCTGIVGSGCDSGGQLFVQDFVESCGSQRECQEACPVITAIAWQESKWASTARSWDWGGCGATNALGAYGVLQFDKASGLSPFPETPVEQFAALKGFSNDYSSFTKWAACSHINPAGSGWVQTMDDVVTKATAWCMTATGLAASDFGAPADYGCGVPAATSCPDGLSPFADTPTSGVCSCGTDWASANSGDIRCGAASSTAAPTPTPTAATAAPTPTPSAATAAPTPTPSAATAAPTSASGSDTGCAVVWGKCGGSGWAGTTCCTAGSDCNRQSAWYSQCVPSKRNLRGDSR